MLSQSWQILDIKNPKVFGSGLSLQIKPRN
jgi:hypothetical protein